MSLPARRVTPHSFPAPLSGPRSTPYAQIEACMGRYLSPILVSSVLRKAMSSRGWVSGVPSGEALDGIVSESMVGLRLFVEPSRLPALMVELAEILESDG